MTSIRKRGQNILSDYKSGFRLKKKKENVQTVYFWRNAKLRGRKN